MSDIGKRLIWVGPADNANTKPLNIEGKAIDAFLPGTILNQTATGFETSTVAATVFGELKIIADKDQMRSRSVDEAWTVDENAVAIQPRSGEFLNVFVATGNNITVRTTALSRNGDGTFKIALTDGTEEIVCFSDEIVNVTGDAKLVRVRFD